MCSLAASGGTLTDGVGVLVFAGTTAPSDYSMSVAISNPGGGGTLALVAGVVPAGMIMTGDGRRMLSGREPGICYRVKMMATVARRRQQGRHGPGGLEMRGRCCFLVFGA